LCPGLDRFLVGDGELVSLCTKIDDLKALLVEEIEAFEKAEKKRRKKVIGVKICRKEKTFVEQKAKNANVYTDHKRHVLCACQVRIENIEEFMKVYQKLYNVALVAFIRGRVESFPFGTLMMRTLFRIECTSEPENELFSFII